MRIYITDGCHSQSACTIFNLDFSTFDGHSTSLIHRISKIIEVLKDLERRRGYHSTPKRGPFTTAMTRRIILRSLVDLVAKADHNVCRKDITYLENIIYANLESLVSITPETDIYDSQVLFRCCEEVFDLCYYGANTLTLFSGTTCNQTEQEICARAVKIILNLCILGYQQFNGSNFEYYADACKQVSLYVFCPHYKLKGKLILFLNEFVKSKSGDGFEVHAILFSKSALAMIFLWQHVK